MSLIKIYREKHSLFIHNILTLLQTYVIESFNLIYPIFFVFGLKFRDIFFLSTFGSLFTTFNQFILSFLGCYVSSNHNNYILKRLKDYSENNKDEDISVKKPLLNQIVNKKGFFTLNSNERKNSTYEAHKKKRQWISWSKKLICI